MARAKILIPKQTLKTLYHDKRLTPKLIGAKFGCSWATVVNRLKEFKIPLKSPALARTRYFKRNFTGPSAERAYMIGFRLGDLNVYQPKGNSETIVVRCHTTQKEQVEVMVSLFSRYGHVNKLANSKGHYYTNSLLNQSFNFLLPKTENVWSWINRREDMLAFVAGYVDAEGNFILNQKKARFKIDSYDKAILDFIYGWLGKNGISCKLRMIQKMGDEQVIYGKTGIYHEDLWRLNVNEALSLRRLIRDIKPYIRHRQRIIDMEDCFNNIQQRIKNGTVKTSDN